MSRSPVFGHRIGSRRISFECLEPRRLLAQFVLNEVSANPPDIDAPFEYIEIKGTPGAILQDLWVLSLDGDAGRVGQSGWLASLAGYSLGANGMAIVKSALQGHVPPAATTIIPNSLMLSTSGGVLPNDSNSFALVYSPAQLTVGTDFDTNDDGTLELPADAVLLDAVGWLDGSSSLDRAYGAVLTQSAGTADAATRLRHATTPLSAAEWFNGDLIGESQSAVTYNAARASANLPASAVLTPGNHNYSLSPANAVPIARDDIFTTPENETLVLSESAGLLRNPLELDADGDILGVVAVNAALPSGHALNVNADGRVFYVPAQDFNGAVSFTYAVSDGAAISLTATATIQVGDLNRPPLLSIGGAPLDFTENSVPRLLVPDAILSDPDSTNFVGGALVVSLAEGDSSSDRLGIAHGGLIEVIATDVRFSGTSLGTITSAGSDGAPLIVDFNSGASIEAVEALLQHLSFQTLGDDPSESARSVELQVSDGAVENDGATSETYVKEVRVFAVNDRPSMAFGGGRTYVENGPTVQLTATATVSDADDVTFEGGSLTVSITSGQEPSDELSIMTLGGITIVAPNRVRYNDSDIGSFSGGYATSLPLVVALSANAHPVATASLVRAIGYRNASEDPSPGPHVVSFVLNDGEADSNPRTRSVTVLPINDAPLITRGGGTLPYARNSAARALLPASDVLEDQPHFGGGNLRVTNLGAKANDRLLILGSFTVETGTNHVRLGSVASGTHIGDLNPNGGLGTTELVVTFTSSATPEIVQQLVRSVRFRTSGAHASLIGQRTINFRLTDSLGLAGNTAFKSVNVV